MEAEENRFERAKKYSNIKYLLAIIGGIYIFALILIALGLGITKNLLDFFSGFIVFDWLIFPVYLAIIFILYYIFTFPLNFYGSFTLEHKFCLSTQNLKGWLLDQLKAGLVSYLISVIAFGAFYYILKHNPGNWWIITSLFWIFFSLILAKLLPVIIIPLFFKYKPLQDARLSERIISLADKMKIRVLDVFEIDFSKKTLKANAGFTGWGNTRRVILADTLKDKYAYDEIEVILAHEFAHYQMKHILKLILINAAGIMLIFYTLFKTNYLILHFFGLSSLENFAAFPVIILYLLFLGIIIQPLENYVSRNFEKKADRQALKITGLKAAFISMMNKLSEQNLSDRSPHPIIKFFFFDHPPVDERIEMADKF